MYHPYLRGKQRALVHSRNGSDLKEAGFRPIIEARQDVLGGLNRALDAVVGVDAAPSSSSSILGIC